VVVDVGRPTQRQVEVSVWLPCKDIAPPAWGDDYLDRALVKDGLDSAALDDVVSL
jgi:hypothetical protein